MIFGILECYWVVTLVYIIYYIHIDICGVARTSVHGTRTCYVNTHVRMHKCLLKRAVPDTLRALAGYAQGVAGYAQRRGRIRSVGAGYAQLSLSVCGQKIKGFFLKLNGCLQRNCYLSVYGLAGYAHVIEPDTLNWSRIRSDGGERKRPNYVQKNLHFNEIAAE